MQELRDLIDYVSPSRLKRLSYFFRRGNSRGKTYADRLYEQVVTRNVNSDQEASRLLFGSENSSHYYKVKHELRNQLHNSVLLIDSNPKDKGTFYDGFLRSRKELYTAEVLWVENHLPAAVDILQKLLPKAIEIELTDIVIPTLNYLRNHAVSYERSMTKFQRYQEQINFWMKVRDAEETIDRLYLNLAIGYAVSAAPPPNKVEEIEAELNRLEENYEGVTTVKYLYFSYFVRYIIADTRGEYQDAITLCWKGVDLIGSKPYTPKGFIRNLLLQIIDASIRIRSLNDGKKAVLKSLTLVDNGNSPWFRINQLYFYLCLRSGEYETAIDITNKMLDHRKFKKLPAPIKERWYLLRAYLSWLIETKVIGETKEQINDFRLGRFLNNVPHFTRDKMGMNVSVLVIQVLWLVQKRKFLAARSRLESLRRYSLRHLANNEGILRTYYFVRLLTQLDNANFHKSAFIRKGEPFLREITNDRNSENMQSVEVEIIPYEELYQYTLSLLEDTIH